jgi:ASC-1-like (ASCH) protein
MRVINLGITSEEEYLIKSGKTVLVRPETEVLDAVAKGDKLKIDGTELLVLDMREYPRLEDLLKIEPIEWVACKGGEISEALRYFSERFQTEKQGGKKFFAIEIAKQ